MLQMKNKHDFRVKKQLIIQHMKYFDNCEFLKTNDKNKPNGEENKMNLLDGIDITVRCKASIFSWILRYLSSEEGLKPVIESDKAISILISADSLMIQTLVEECVRYIKDNFVEVMKYGNIHILKSHLMRKLAKSISVDSLDSVNLDINNFVLRLYKKKLEIMFEKPLRTTGENLLLRCKLCGEIFTKQGFELTPCSKNELFITSNGEAIPSHLEDQDWELNNFILKMK